MQATRLGEPAVAFLRLAVPDQMLPQPEGDVGPGHVLGGARRARPGTLGVERMPARPSEPHAPADEAAPKKTTRKSKAKS